MPKKIILVNSHYRPATEAISQETQILRHSLENAGFSVEIFQRSHSERNNFFFIVDLIKHFRKARKWINDPDTYIHIFATSRNLFFRILFRGAQRIFLTLIDITHLTHKYAGILDRHYKFIVVESDIDQNTLINMGCDQSKIILARPFSSYESHYEQEKLSFPSPEKPFRLLMASMPFHVRDFDRRGIDIALGAAEVLGSQIEITMACRSSETYRKLLLLADHKKTPNIRLLKLGQCQIAEEIFRAHAMLLPMRYRIKSCPNSLLEGLSLARPVLVSSSTQLSELVREQGCGEIFEPSVDALVKAIENLKRNYASFQPQARKTYHAFFSKAAFLNAYSDAYRRLTDAPVTLR